MYTFLVVSVDATLPKILNRTLGHVHRVLSASSIAQGVEIAGAHKLDRICLHLDRLEPYPRDDTEIRDILRHFWGAQPTARIIVVGTVDQTPQIVTAIQAGADDFLLLPVNGKNLHSIIEKGPPPLRVALQLDTPQRHLRQHEADWMLETQNAPMQEVLEQVQRVAPTRATVLLSGETGTGKGVLARFIHRRSRRFTGPFLSVHCGAIPDPLLESELFGHEKGAFTGASKRKAGKFELADGGTIFLDEIGTVTPSMQIKLLQVLQDGTFERLGSEQTVTADTRIIAATNADLRARVHEGTFRSDLFYRLSVFPIHLPPLRQRREDIKRIVAKIIDDLNHLYGKNIQAVHPVVMETFRSYDWPGNIREMENLLERAYILEHGRLLAPESFPQELFAAERKPLIPIEPCLTLAAVRRSASDNAERQYLKNALRLHQGRIKDTARAAGISPPHATQADGQTRVAQRGFQIRQLPTK